MDEKKENESHHNLFKYTATSFLVTSLATLGLMRAGNYRAALLFYPKSGGGGFNIYKEHENGKLTRCFAVDYHPFWNHKTQQSEWKLHYHRGKNSSQMNKHRPYQGGW